jgi:hypothetical protein
MGFGFQALRAKKGSGGKNSGLSSGHWPNLVRYSNEVMKALINFMLTVRVLNVIR